jgi:acyl-CoA reductase-like NAD-dependent aldehyde dehydrogenase
MTLAEQTLAPTEANPDTRIEKRLARMLIDGAWVDSLSGAFLSVENPAKRCPVAEVPRGDAADVNGAVEAAARAFSAWSKIAPRDRGRFLLRIADTLETRSEELARTIALETGTHCELRRRLKRSWRPIFSAISAGWLEI